MATRKRAASRSRLNRAVKAGRSALRSAEKRLPPDVRKQIDRSIKDGQKRLDTAVKDVRTRVNKAARQADLDRVMKRLDGLSKQVSQLARRVTTRPAAATAAARKPATRRSTPRRPAPSMEPVIRYVPPSIPEAPGPMPVRVETEST